MDDLKILLVEDNPGDAMLMEELLLENNQFSFSFHTTETLKSGITAVQKSKYDIVLLDLGLPDSHGLLALEKMLENANDTPIIVITGLDDEETGRKAINMGAQSYVVKGLMNSRLVTDSISFAVERNNNLQELKQKDLKLEEINNQLQESNKAIRNLIAIISHDLRGPIKSVLPLLEMLKADFNEIDEAKKMQIINASIRSLGNTADLMDNLLEWARSQSNENKIDPQMVSTKSFIDQALEPLLNIATQKEIQLYNETDKNHRFFCDINMLTTVFRNLVSNSIKFTPKKGRIHISSFDNNDGVVSISVKDTGIGIKKEDVSKIFDIAEGFTTSGTENEKGTGFGLILCKEFIEKNNGNIKVESKLNEGTTITVTLPNQKK